MYKAWQASMREDRWDAYLWLNDDTLLNSDALGMMVDDYDVTRIVVGELEDASGSIVYGLRTNGIFTGNCVLVPDAVCDKLGLICEDYSHAWGDTDYAMRAKRAGITVVSVGVVGIAESHPNRPSLKNLSLGDRLSLLRNPKGWNLHDLWLYRRRNWGICVAVISCIHLIFYVIAGER
jgi:GT2 family glycosyltransferase